MEKGGEVPDMKVAILTMQRVLNFGSVLQAYSLREMIREVTGDTPAFLDIDSRYMLPGGKVADESPDYAPPAAFPPGLLQKGKRRIIKWLSAGNKNQIRRFMQRELKLDEPDAAAEYDCVVIGSDEVFNHGKGINLQLHGNIPQAKRVITYAASCGSAVPEDILQEHRTQVRNALANISAVSVRDTATEQYVSALGVREMERHLDPVLTGRLNARRHRAVALNKYLLVYAYGQRIRTKEEIDAVKGFARSRGLKTVAMGGSQFWCDLYIPTSPFRLLDYFYHADYVVTDTFHGCIFSVINHRKFAVIQRQSNSRKIKSLLEDLDLTGRLVTDMASLEKVLEAPVDYDCVEAILQRERIRTREYLKEQLRG